MMRDIADHFISAGLTMQELVDEFKAVVLVSALKETNGNICRCARKHNVHRNTLARLMQRLGVKIETRKPAKKRHKFNRVPASVLDKNLYPGG